jgi:hypothetical protein
MAQPKKPKNAKKVEGTKVFFISPDESPSEEEDKGGMFLEKEDIQIIYYALRAYKPTADEEQRYELLLEEFDEILAIDYNDMIPDMN